MYYINIYKLIFRIDFLQVCYLYFEFFTFALALCFRVKGNVHKITG